MIILRVLQLDYLEKVITGELFCPPKFLDIFTPFRENCMINDDVTGEQLHEISQSHLFALVIQGIIRAIKEMPRTPIPVTQNSPKKRSGARIAYISFINMRISCMFIRVFSISCIKDRNYCYPETHFDPLNCFSSDHILVRFICNNTYYIQYITNVL